jgi:hypothetical protein
MTAEQMEQAQADESARQEKRSSSARYSNGGQPAVIPVDNPLPSQAQFMAPADPPPPFTTHAPVYIKDVSMKDTSQYNTDAQLLAACKAKGISPYFATQLMRLREYSSIRLVLDDSGSMKAMMHVPGERPRSRWELLQEMVREIFGLLSIARGGPYDPIDVFFLNSLPGGMKAASIDSLIPFFNKQPNGRTPTLALFQNIFTPDNMVKEEGVLTLLVTDGAPDCGHALMRQFLLDSQRRFVASYITVGLCTDDPGTIDEYESSLDNGIPRLDVMSPYAAERIEIRQIQPRGFTFSYQDWCVKFLLGSRVVEWDALDEKRLTKEQLRRIKDFSEGYMGGGGGGNTAARTSGSGRNSGGKDKKCLIM